MLAPQRYSQCQARLKSRVGDFSFDKCQQRCWGALEEACSGNLNEKIYPGKAVVQTKLLLHKMR